MQVRSVIEITRHIKSLIEGDESLGDLWINGEVSNFSRASSGHCYFTLKDAEAEIRCVMWRNRVSQLYRLPQQGDLVDAHGYVSVYERGGAYQFYVDILYQHEDIGDRWRAFLELKERLEAEGVFDEGRKRPLPEWPRRIGVVTSPTGAALRDILRVLAERYPLIEVVVSPSLVQGAEAPLSLVRAIEELNRLPDIDVMIVARGGGSMEDLWAFNDERVARAVAASRVPVVSGVGHETDFTIIDFVADLRAATPSIAAAAVVPDAGELRGQIEAMKQRLGELIRGEIDRRREGVRQSAHLLRLHDPRRVLGERRQRLDELLRRGKMALERTLGLRRTWLAGQTARLQALNPRSVMARGYAVVQDGSSGARIHSVKQVVPGQEVRIHVQDGRLDAQVTKTSDADIG